VATCGCQSWSWPGRNVSHQATIAAKPRRTITLPRAPPKVPSAIAPAAHVIDAMSRKADEAGQIEVKSSGSPGDKKRSNDSGKNDQ